MHNCTLPRSILDVEPAVSQRNQIRGAQVKDLNFFWSKCRLQKFCNDGSTVQWTALFLLDQLFLFTVRITRIPDSLCPLSMRRRCWPGEHCRRHSRVRSNFVRQRQRSNEDWCLDWWHNTSDGSFAELHCHQPCKMHQILASRSEQTDQQVKWILREV